MKGQIEKKSTFVKTSTYVWTKPKRYQTEHSSFCLIYQFMSDALTFSFISPKICLHKQTATSKNKHAGSLLPCGLSSHSSLYIVLCTCCSLRRFMGMNEKCLGYISNVKTTNWLMKWMILVVVKALDPSGRPRVLVFMWMVFEPCKHCFIQSKPPHASNMNQHFSDIRQLCRAFCSWNDQFDLQGCLSTCLPRYRI